MMNSDSMQNNFVERLRSTHAVHNLVERLRSTYTHSLLVSSLFDSRKMTGTKLWLVPTALVEYLSRSILVTKSASAVQYLW